jgi:molybdopterin synthase sulfur carrier subunit
MRAMNHAVVVKLFAGVRDAFGESRVVVPASADLRVCDLLAGICADSRQERAIFTRQGLPRPELVIMVNGRNVAFLEGLATSLHPGDEVAVFPPISGG